MSTPSPIFARLAAMLHTARTRMEAVDLLNGDDMAPSRCWSRQRNGLVDAILAEPPVTVADALIILAALSEWRDLMEGVGEDMTTRERRDLDEVTTTAIANVNLCFGAHLARHKHHTPEYRDTLRWLDQQQARWLPRADEVQA
jgi:hypothetical protein